MAELLGFRCLQVILGRVAEVATLFDDDGIVIRYALLPPLLPRLLASTTVSMFCMTVRAALDQEVNC